MKACRHCNAHKVVVTRYTRPATRTFTADGTEQRVELPGLIVGVKCPERFDVLIRDCCTVTFKTKQGSLVVVEFIAKPKRGGLGRFVPVELEQP